MRPSSSNMNASYGLAISNTLKIRRVIKLTNEVSLKYNWFNFNLLSITSVSLNFIHKSRHYS